MAKSQELPAGAGERAPRVLELLKRRYPNPGTVLEHASPWQLLVATVLAAQCTDERVNKVTPTFFSRWPTPKELADIFLELEEMGADNLNLVTPDHVSPLICEALALRKPRIPVVYNSGGYCRVRALEEIAPYVDIWLPDCKFVSPELSARYTGRRDYFEYAAPAIAFMAKKPLIWSGEGKLLSGVIVRHLILPGCTSDSLRVLGFLKETLPEDVPVSLMRQYTPTGGIAGFPELNRTLTAREYRRVLGYAEQLGFPLFTQEKASADTKFIPDWDY